MHKAIATVGIAWAAVTLAAGCGDDRGTHYPLATGQARFAVVRSDYESTAIALLNEDGEITNPKILSSGSTPPGLVTALSGDVVLSDTRRGEEGVLHVIDRRGTDVITRLDLDTRETPKQRRVAPQTGGFSSNPHDMAIVTATRAWTSRYGVNLDESAPPFDRGNDIVELNPTAMTLTGRRIDLSSFNSTGLAMRDLGPEVVPVFARPHLLVVIGDTLVVGMDLLSSRFDAAAPGHLALIDVNNLAVQRFALPTASRNCGAVRAVPGAADRVLVACSGFARPSGEARQLRASAGVYVVQVSGGGARIVRSWEPRDETAPLAVRNVVPLDATTFIGVQAGTSGNGDTAFIVDLAAGTSTTLLETPEPFSVGLTAFDPATGRVLIPDAWLKPGGLHRYRRTTRGILEREEPLTFIDEPLPARAAYRLR